jgi:hypothetical protein
MDKLSEFFKELKDRFSNPFFFSFAVSWVCINWKIWVGLFFYSIADLQKDGYSSYIDMISRNISWLNSLFFPFGLAMLYTFGFPIFRNMIVAFNSWNQKWGMDLALKYAKGGKVPVEKYIQLREIYEKRTRLLDEILANESKFINENEALRDEKMQIQDRFNNLSDHLNEINRKGEIGQFNGEWDIKFYNDGNVYSTRYSISGGKIYSSAGVVRERAVMEIKYFATNGNSGEVIIIFSESEGLSPSIFYQVFRPRSSNSLKLLQNVDEDGKILELRKMDL